MSAVQCRITTIRTVNELSVTMWREAVLSSASKEWTEWSLLLISRVEHFSRSRIDSLKYESQNGSRKTWLGPGRSDRQYSELILWCLVLLATNAQFGQARRTSAQAHQLIGP